MLRSRRELPRGVESKAESGEIRNADRSMPAAAHENAGIAHRPLVRKRATDRCESIEWELARSLVASRG